VGVLRKTEEKIEKIGVGICSRTVAVSIK